MKTASFNWADPLLLMAGLQVALVLSFIGCVVSEFVASRAGLGQLIKNYANDLNVSVMFACIV